MSLNETNTRGKVIKCLRDYESTRFSFRGIMHASKDDPENEYI